MICICGALMHSDACRLRAHVHGPTRDYGREAQRDAEAHLEECYDALADEDAGEEVPWPETAGPFCGCETCVVREVLFAAYPVFAEGFAAGDLP